MFRSHRGRLAIVLLIALAGCRHARVASTPGQSVRAWYLAIYLGRPDAAVALCSKQMRDFAGDSALKANFTALGSTLPEETVDMRIFEERIDGNYAQVVFAPPGGNRTGRDSAQLIREGDGVWRIALGRP